MTVTGIIAAIVIGAIIGGLARLILPGKQNIPIWLTIVVGIVAALGTGLALLSLYIHIQRLAFEVAVGLLLLAALGLTRLVIGLRKY